MQDSQLSSMGQPPLRGIHRLPPEILAIIFEFALSPDRNLARRLLVHEVDTLSSYCTHLIALTHVSSAWRATAIAYPSFWTRINANSNASREHFAERAGILHLSVQVSLPTNDLNPEVLHFLQNYGPRIVTLDLYITPHTMHNLEDALTFAPLALTCLRIRSSQYQKTGPAQSITSFLTRAAPQLRALAIAPCESLSYFAKSLPKLTHLYLSLSWSHLTLVNILEALVATPNLECLHISHLSKASAWPPVTGFPSVALNCLRSIAISDKFGTPGALKLMHVLSIPHARLVRLVLKGMIYSERGPEDPFLQQLPALADATSIELWRLTNQVRVVTATDDALTPSGLWIDVDNQWSWRYTRTKRLFTSLLARTVAILPPWNVRHVRLLVQRGEDGDVAAILDLLPDMPQVTELVFEVDMEELIRDPPNSLHPLDQLCRVLSRPPVVCPALDTLAVLVVMSAAVLDPHVRAVLEAMLAARKRAGHPLRRLALQLLPADSAERLTAGAVAQFYAPLAPLVETFECFEPAPRVPAQVFRTRMVSTWGARARQAGVERYWEIPVHDRPQFHPYYAEPGWAYR